MKFSMNMNQYIKAISIQQWFYIAIWFAFAVYTKCWIGIFVLSDLRVRRGSFFMVLSLDTSRRLFLLSDIPHQGDPLFSI